MSLKRAAIVLAAAVLVSIGASTSVNQSTILHPCARMSKVAFAFACLVLVVLAPMSADAQDVDAAYFEATAMTFGSFAKVGYSSTATNGSALKFTAAGTATKSVTTTTHGQDVVVKARAFKGSASTLPDLIVKVDGVTYLTTRDLTGTWTDYSAVVEVPAGAHTISVGAANMGSGRELWVDTVRIPADAAPPNASATVTGELKKWHPLTLSFDGPQASETDSSPNPFLDYRLQVTFTGPSGQQYLVPGFFDGDGNGGATGNVWRVRFSPDQAGTWSYKAAFRKGSFVAVDLSPTAGSPTSFDGASGTFLVADRDPAAPGFLKWGRLRYVGTHYLKFRDGPYWLKGGADSPENLLAYTGFDNTPQAHHSFSPHVRDWHSGDLLFNTSSTDGGKGLIGALNYLSSQQVNSIYFLPMNIGGDGQDTSPYVKVASWAGSTSNDNKHFDISKLRQWGSAFAFAQRKGIHLHFVLNEAEEANKRELDNATLGVERKLFYRELVARFGHHNALQWNLCEEYDFVLPISPTEIKNWAGYVQQLDPYDHPVTVHHTYNPDSAWTPFLGDSRFSLTAFQYAGGVAGYGAEVEEWRRKTASAGRRLTISMDELATATTSNADQQRKAILWPTYLSGGQLEWYIGAEDRSLEDFRRYQGHWTYTRHARTFMQQNLPFWKMAPQDGLLSGESSDYGGGQVFAKAGEVYAVYLPNATSSGTLDLSGVSGSFQKRWYNPRTGAFEGTTQTISGGGKRGLGTPPSSSSDWVVLLKATG